jgi:hypothetical protein
MFSVYLRGLLDSAHRLSSHIALAFQDQAQERYLGATCIPSSSGRGKVRILGICMHSAAEHTGCELPSLRLRPGGVLPNSGYNRLRRCLNRGCPVDLLSPTPQQANLNEVGICQPVKPKIYKSNLRRRVAFPLLNGGCRSRNNSLFVRLSRFRTRVQDSPRHEPR